MADQGVTSAHVELEIEIDAPQEEVWKSLLDDIGQWWPRDFFVTENSKFILEPKIGGHIYEDAGDGAGLIWFKITGLMPPKQMIFEGHIAPPWGGPCMSLLSITLEESSGKTTFRLNDHLCGVLPQKDQSQLDQGWKLIFEEHFKKHVEKQVS